VAIRIDARGKLGKNTMRTVCLLARRRLKEEFSGRRADQAETLFEGRLLQLSKA
jgi:hypothetical protein